ncbi:MAG: type II secretion system GspH family protein [Planctomycetaceae bacterium]|jgi:prepilin-type N-terminal cleavage/methylation domain-containing protein|nr:type II secretion system GspH family protein [Planctomycetaceae bacterium]
MNYRKAFTLVELLVVITIIGILSSLITAGVMGAMRSAKQARIKMTMGQVELALEQYKNKYGEYPPDWSDQKAVLRHVKKRWPRFVFTTTTDENQYIEFCSLLYYASGWDPRHGNSYTPEDMAFAGSLPFWLGGLPNDARGVRYNTTNSRYERIENDGSFTTVNLTDPQPNWNNKELTSLIGFSANPANPFDVGTKANRPSLEEPTMEFEVGKNLAIFVRNPNPDNVNGDRCTAVAFIDSGPIVYFRASSAQGEPFAYRVPANSDGTWNSPGNWYGNLFSNNTVGADGKDRFKTLWNRDQYDNNKDGFGYRFARNESAGLTRFYPGIACPYLQKGNYNSANDGNSNVYFNPKSYQLVHPGLDGKFGGWLPNGIYGNASKGGEGRGADLATGNGVTQFDLDNIVNFGDGATLKSLLP